MLWVYISESFPDRHRAAALGVLSLANSAANLLAVYSALYLMNVMAHCPPDAQVDDDSECSPDAHATGAAWLFCMMSGTSLLTMAFVATFVDETAGLNLDKLEPSEPNALCSRLGLCTMGDSERPPPESPPVHVRDGAAPPRRRTTQRHSNSGFGAATTEPLLA